LIVGDAIYVQAGGGFVKLDKHTGETVWRTLEDGGGMYGSAFSSPIHITLAGKPQLIVQTRTELAGVSEEGDVLWKKEVPAFRGMNILTPTVVGDTIFTSSYGGGSFLFTAANDGEWKLNEQWTNKLQGYMSSPVVVDGHLYLHLRNQRFACIDLATGEETWITKPFGKYWSLLANGDKLLALDEGGELLLIQANPTEFKLLDEKEVANDSWAHVVVVGNEVYVRDLGKLKKFLWGQ
jgi:outer membrane protein assembly factor BamB